MEAFNAASQQGLGNLVYPGGGRRFILGFYPYVRWVIGVKTARKSLKSASAVSNLVLISLTSGAALAALFAPQITRYLLAPGFAGDPSKND